MNNKNNSGKWNKEVLAALVISVAIVLLCVAASLFFTLPKEPQQIEQITSMFVEAIDF